MLPPGTIILDKKPFLHYDSRTENTKNSMKESHYHNFYEIYYLIQGKCDYLIDNKVYSLNEHGLIFIPSGVIHRAIYKTPTHSRIVLNFTSDYIDPVLTDYLKNVWFCNLTDQKYINDINSIFAKLSYEVYGENEISNLLKMCHFTELLAFISKNYHIITDCDEVTKKPIKLALRYITNNYSQNITLEQLAEQTSYNKDYFSKLFKKSVGTGFKEYLLLTRLNASEKLLTTTNKSITEIAISCGFNDSNYFSTAFKNLYGIPPLKYRYIQKD